MVLKPWLDSVGVHLGDADVFEVYCSANQTVIIDKLYGPLCAHLVRIRLEYGDGISDWVVESQDDPGTDVWTERARWDCQVAWLG